MRHTLAGKVAVFCQKRIMVLLGRTEFLYFWEIHVINWKMPLIYLQLNILELLNMNKLIFGHLIVNYIRNNYDLLCEKVKGFIVILLVK